MSQPNENTSQPTKSQTEFSVDISGEKTHVEFTIPSKQVKQILRPLTLLVSHLIAAGLATVSINPTLLNLPVAPPTSPPGLNECNCNSRNFE